MQDKKNKINKIVIDTTNYQTIDLDLIDKNTLKHIIEKIKKRKCCKQIQVRDTFKGYHIIISCKKDCDECRMVFDDQKRYYYDQYRPKHLRNILWTEKYYKMVM